ncbi:MAG: monovalent cation/H+ antiporter subunit D family protein [Deltaproteobacteria bacterium]|nr:monovalent cation/H+ antiporter subunit D family protein [Deltaproteobacteria bacterium]
MALFLSMEYRPLWAVALPGLVSILILFSKNRPNLREMWTVAGSVCLFTMVLSMNAAVAVTGPLEVVLFPLFPGVAFHLRADAPGLIFATTASCLWILVSVYSIGYMRVLKEHAQTRFYFCFAVALFSAVGVAFSANLVTLFIFYEILTLSTYPLVAHEESPEAVSAGHKYLAYLLTGGVFFLIAILMTYHWVSSTGFHPQGILLPAAKNIPGWALSLVFVFFLIGCAKAAWMPLHAWLPSAMVAPTPVSALLHAVAVVKAGVFCIFRVVYYVYGLNLMAALHLGMILAVIAAFTILAANLYAVGQDNLKRMLAYSTINQLSFIILGIALLSPMAAKGALLHIPFHGFMKITLFLCAGAAAAIAGKKEISKMKGIGRALPITLGAFMIGAFGMCGAPPLAGFLSKWHIALGAIQSGGLVFLGVILAGSLLDVVYFFPVIREAFFGKIPESQMLLQDAEERVAPLEEKTKWMEKQRPLYLFMVIPLTVTAAFSILLCLFPGIFFIHDLAALAVTDIFGGR